MLTPRTLAAGAAGLALATAPAHADLCPADRPGVTLPGIFLRFPIRQPKRSRGLGVEISHNCASSSDPIMLGGLIQAEVGFDGGARFALAAQGGPGMAGGEAGLFLETGDALRGGLHLAPFVSGGVIWGALRLSIGPGGVRGDWLLGAKLPLGMDEADGPSYFFTGGQDTPGRPLRADGAVLLPTLLAWRPGVGWVATALDGLEPPARAWARQALLERASVDAFVKISAELAALGAPAWLTRATLQAAAEEADHAARCLKHASHLAGVALRADAPPWPTPERCPEALRARLIHEAVHDGLVGEATAAAEAHAAAAHAADGAVRATLRRIARDEARHAALAHHILRFCLHTGGRPAADALADSARALRASPPPRSLSGRALHWLKTTGQAPRVTATDVRPARRAAAALLAIPRQRRMRTIM